jgi:hypothetical protein
MGAAREREKTTNKKLYIQSLLSKIAKKQGKAF